MLVEVLIYTVFIVLTCVIIWRASDGFEVASEFLGRNLSEGVRGATINAIGSSMPELFATILFLFIVEGDPDEQGSNFAGGIGTTAGSAVFNGVIIPALVILTVLGAGLATQVNVTKKVILRDGIALLIGELILILFIGGGYLDWWHGVALMLIYVVYVTYMLTSMRRNRAKEGLHKISAEEYEDPEEAAEEAAEDINPELERSVRSALIGLATLDLELLVVQREMRTLNAWILLILSMLVIGGACFLLVHSCEQLGEALNVPIYFIAVILASAATSVPDTILSIRDARKGNYDDAVSNAIGSNIFDICFALGFPLMLYTLIQGPIVMSDSTAANVTQLQLILVGITVVAVAIFYLGKSLGRLKAFGLLALYVLFVAYIVGDPEAFGMDYSDGISNFLLQIDSSLDGLRFWTK